MTNCQQVWELIAKLKRAQVDLRRLARRLALIDRKEFKFSSYDVSIITAQSLTKDLSEKIRILITQIQIGKAREILDVPDEINVLGPEQIQQTWDIELKPQDIPLMPFSYEDLKRAKEIGQMLVLRVSHTNNGQPLSLAKMVDIIQPRWDREDRGKLLCTYDDYQNWKNTMGTDFSTKPPRAGWALVSKDLLPDSTNKNYLQQTEVIIQYLQEQVFKHVRIPEAYQEAIQEFAVNKDRLIELINRDRQAAGKELTLLKINRLTRQSNQEIVYDLAFYYHTNNIRLQKDYIWMNVRSADDTFLALGGFIRKGLYILHETVWESNRIGVLLSRS